MTRRLLGAVRGVFSIILATVVAACAAAVDTRTLVIWHAWGGSELKALKELVRGYKAQHPDQDVMLLQVPYDKLKDKYTRSAAANGGPDIVIGDADWSGKFATADLVLPISELFTQEDLTRFHPRLLEALSWKGQAYALPESRETVVLYYNRRFVPAPPKSLAELFQRAAIIHTNSNGTVKGFVFNGSFYYAMGWFFGSGGNIFDPSGNVSVASEAGRFALRLVDQMSKSPGMMVSHEYAKPDSMYKEGQAAMIINGPWALMDYRAALGDDLGVATLPRLDRGSAAASWVGIKCLMFNPQSDVFHRAMARDFALFMTETKSQEVLATLAGHIPVVRGYTAPADSSLGVFQMQADVGTPVSIAPEMAVVWDPMDRALRKVVQGELPPEASLDEAQVAIAAKVKELRTAQR
ncbi:MAG: extracellular solute-binding protein [Candidatus Sericytochromatia bacterium]|nr:extracellular solute-binding protein [Candidatus Sericytochromatia bacterium]